MTGLPGKVENLPKWAQKDIESLQRDAAQLRRENDGLRATLAGNGGSCFRVEGLSTEDIPLPDRARSVTWQADDGFELRIYSEGGDLKIMGTTWHGIALRPGASNVIRVGRGRTR